MNISFPELRNIAIIRRNGFGDVLCTMPLVHLCRSLAPQAKIHLFVDEMTAPLVPYLDGPDTVSVLEPSSNKYGQIIKTAWRHRKERFDLAISGKTTPMRLMNLSLALLRARKRAAYVGKSWDAHLINCPKPWVREEKHQALKLLQLLDPISHIPPAWFPRLKNVTAISRPDHILVSVSNNRAGSALSLERMAACIDVPVCITALEKDRAQAEKFAQMLTVSSELFIGRPFSEFLGLIKGVRGVFVGDGGISHLAAALDKPQVVLFGGTKVWEWGPLSDKARCLAHPHNVNEIPLSEITKAITML